jgi:hypothetical protein
MTDTEMLDQLSAEGEEAEADFNDSEKVFGWFGWDVIGDVLTITYTKDGEPKQIAQWRLVKL